MAKDTANKPDPDEDEDLDGAEGAPKKKIPLMFIIGGAAAAVILLGGGTTAFLLLGHKPAGAHQDKAPKKEDKKKDDKKKDDKNGAQIADGPDGVVFYTPPDIVVNMQTADGKPTFLKLKLTMELPDKATADVLDENMPRLQDMFQTFLRELRPEDLNGSQGTFQLRMELLRRVRLVVAPAQVNTVLIEEMLIN
ncbi:flagellar basal body-associated FliL family protein [Phenylobacterium montanum]|uniref:Flagellar protein FliL n=1 Tax=Phenylobacterium montanum TaxID=2823693 RepID=A0A975IUS3_9CAUL|nr:flagellar basal body-associated FliL family protein [Caulobacter sp. S6]QUD87824.1 flagellar basal body-associated FliL family protein [Caulobacter sp. S6]